MADEAVQGLAETYAAFGIIPDAVRDEMAVEIGIIARDYLALQQARAPRATGLLESQLSIAVQVDQLRAKVGLIGNAQRKFVGRILEFGRNAQTVLVQRRRRVSGQLRLRGRRKIAADIATTYMLHVKARAPQPFVQIGDADLDSIAAQRLADFWEKALARADAGAFSA